MASPRRQAQDLLGVSETATPTRIGKAYRKQALQYHPDRYPGPEAEEQMKRVNHARDIALAEAERRTREGETDRAADERRRRHAETARAQREADELRRRQADELERQARAFELERRFRELTEREQFARQQWEQTRLDLEEFRRRHGAPAPDAATARAIGYAIDAQFELFARAYAGNLSPDARPAFQRRLNEAGQLLTFARRIGVDERTVSTWIDGFNLMMRSFQFRTGASYVPTFHFDLAGIPLPRGTPTDPLLERMALSI